jgi:AcrR family transcriptional regulator
VADEAGASVGGIYRRFANKEQLLRAIKDNVLTRADAMHKNIAAHKVKTCATPSGTMPSAASSR